MKKNLFLLLFFLIQGCAVIEPLAGGFNIISLQDEKALGVKTAQEITKEKILVSDISSNARVRNIGARLVSVLPQKDFDYEFFVVKDDTPNAFTIPGGKIYVHTGLLNFVQDDSELAGVLGHEIGHAFERHPAKSLSRAYGVEFLSKLLFRQNQAQLQGFALQIAKGGILMKYSRQDEYEADLVGYDLLRKGGYRTDGLLRFLARLQTLEKGGRTLSFLSSHPPTPDRVARLQALENSGGVVTYGRTTTGSGLR